MNITIPILVNTIEDCELPVSLYKDNLIDIILSEFSIPDKEYLYGIINLQIEGTSSKFGVPNDSSSSHQNFGEYITAPFRLIIKTQDTDSTRTFDIYSLPLNFCSILYFEYPNNLKIFENKTSMHSVQKFRNKAIKPKINKEVVESFKNTLAHCIKNDTVTAKKMTMLHSLLNITILESFNSALICSTYISILESLFTDENTEITYRFSLRMTKYLNEDYQFFKRMKKLYGKRSTYYHVGEKDFNTDDEVFLSELTRRIIIEYIQNPERFDITRLDEDLLT